MLIWLALAGLIALLIGYGIFVFFVMISIWTGAPYVPSSGERTRRMIDLAEIRPGERAVDLGSGDGRLLRAAARARARVVGWGMDPAPGSSPSFIAAVFGARRSRSSMSSFSTFCRKPWRKSGPRSAARPSPRRELSSTLFLFTNGPLMPKTVTCTVTGPRYVLPLDNFPLHAPS